MSIPLAVELERVADSYHRDGNAPYTVDLLLRARHEIIELRRNRRQEKIEKLKLSKSVGSIL